jgi:hypothetical protein
VAVRSLNWTLRNLGAQCVQRFAEDARYVAENAQRVLDDGSRAVHAVRDFANSSLGMTTEPAHRLEINGRPSVRKGKTITVFDPTGTEIVSVPKDEFREMFFWPVKGDKSKVDLWVWRKRGDANLSYEQEYAATFNKADVKGLVLNPED